MRARNSSFVRSFVRCRRTKQHPVGIEKMLLLLLLPPSSIVNFPSAAHTFPSRPLFFAFFPDFFLLFIVFPHNDLRSSIRTGVQFNSKICHSNRNLFELRERVGFVSFSSSSSSSSSFFVLFCFFLLNVFRLLFGSVSVNFPSICLPLVL